MLIQLWQPVILLTDATMTGEDLRLVLRHEMIHLKRKDLWYRWALLLAVAINWFNPAVYAFSKAFTCFCELSCDEKVTEGMPEAGRYRYSMIIIHMAGDKANLSTLFSSFSCGGKRYMKNRIFSILSITKKKWGIAAFVICFLSIFCAGAISLAPANQYGTLEISGERQISSGIIKTDEEIEREMEEAFAETFSNEFKEDDFPGMVIFYDESGIPVVTDPDVSQKSAVYACGKYERNGLYSSSDCSDSSLVFYILADRPIEVLDSAASTAAAKVKYAGAGGYMKKNGLKF